jgi:UDP-3-O-[3-hydroxymyristoyl] glucosamine N-acyltransferase
MFAGQVGVAGHLKVADGTKAAAQTGVAGDIKEPNTTIMGSPAFEHKHYLKTYVIFKKLPDLVARINSLERAIDLVKNR